MADKFNPAPPDKHAADAKENVARDKAKDDELDKSLKDSFPASDPVSPAQPSKTKPDGG